MKTSLTKPLLIASLGIGAFLTSCVDPYSQGYDAPQVSNYRPGYEVRTLPSGYRTEVISGTSYYHSNGTYYRPRGGRYVVVEAPRRGGYESSRPVRRDRGRDVIVRERGRDVVVTQLPRGSRVVDYRGARYYQVRDTYYQRRGQGYVIVNRPY